jgi:hypothetical protein
MAGVPKISDPQERERNVEHNIQRKRLHHGGPQSLVGNPVPRDKSKLQPSARVLRK